MTRKSRFRCYQVVKSTPRYLKYRKIVIGVPGGATLQKSAYPLRKSDGKKFLVVLDHILSTNYGKKCLGHPRYVHSHPQEVKVGRVHSNQT